MKGSELSFIIYSLVIFIVIVIYTELTRWRNNKLLKNSLTTAKKNISDSVDESKKEIDKEFKRLKIMLGVSDDLQQKERINQ